MIEWLMTSGCVIAAITRVTHNLLEMRLAEEGIVDLHGGCTDFRHVDGEEA